MRRRESRERFVEWEVWIVKDNGCRKEMEEKCGRRRETGRRE